MKFSITPDNFQLALGQVAAAVPNRSTVPIYMNVLIEADEHGVRFTATDTDIGLRARAAAQVEESGQLAVPARKLLEIVRLLPAAMAQVETNGETLTVRCGKARFVLHGIRTDDSFLPFPKVELEDGWNIPVAALEKMIARVSFAVSTEVSRPVLNGVLWELQSDTMAMVATDGHRLARLETKIEGGPDKRVALIVPPRALAQVPKLFDSEGTVKLFRSDNSIVLQQGELVLYARLIEGPYPNYQQVIPRDNDKTAVVDNQALQATLRRVSVVANEQTHRVLFSFGGGVLRLSVDTPDLGQAHDEVEVGYSGEPLEIAFNATYFLEVLRAFSAEQVRISLKASERPTIIEPVDASEDEAKRQLALVMPLRLIA